MLTRRRFLSHSAVAAAGMLSGLGTAGRLLAQTAPGYRALVAIFLQGGADTFQFLVPDEDDEYAIYALTRDHVAVGQADLLPVLDASNRRFGIHPLLPGMQGAYTAGDLAWVANVGTLIRPVTLSQYNSKLYRPVGLYAHDHQQRIWQTSQPEERIALTGWLGRTAELIGDTASTGTIPISIAIDGNRTIMKSLDAPAYVVSGSGASATNLSGYGGAGQRDQILTQATDLLLAHPYEDAIEQAFATRHRNAIDDANIYDSAVGSVTLETVFPSGAIGNRLKQVARAIAARTALGHSRQMFVVNAGRNYDLHGGLTSNFATILPELDAALAAFRAAMVELGTTNDVTSFSFSDFGRTLDPNTSGTDHGWGSNMWVEGGSVQGGVYGDYPTSLALGNSLDTGRGRLIPTTSVDEYAAELLLWLGLADSDLDYVLPNVRNFPGGLGFLA